MNFVAIVALLLASGHAAMAQKYAAYIPKYIRPGLDYSVDVEILDYDGTITVTATLTSPDYSAQAFDVLSKDQTASLGLGQLPYDYDGSKSFKVTVTGWDSVKEKEVFVNSTTDIQYQKKFLSMFIQTDKAIYKPGHTIKFRAVVTTPDLLPYQGLVSYKLQDPNGNIILREEDVQLDHGVAGNHFKLGKHSTQGNWKITYAVHGYEESITVSVEEYTLPKFSAKIKTDQAFLHPGTPRLTGKLTGEYTFGQPVRGKARVEVSMDRWYSRNRIPPKIIIQYPDFDGTGEFDIDANEIIDKLEWNPKSYSSSLKIFGVVTDMTTGEEADVNETISLHTVKMKVETLAKPEHIKPGLPYVAYLKISQQDGSLLSDEDMEDLEVEIEASYSYSYDWRINWDLQKKNTVITAPVKVGADGVIIYKTVAINDDFQDVNFRVLIPSYPDKDQWWTSWSAQRFESQSNTFLQVSTDDTFLSVGGTARLTVYTTEVSQQYRITLMARGKVIKTEMYTPMEYVTTPTYSNFKYSFMVEAEFSPSVYAVVSFVRDNGEFIADSVKINVQAAMEHQVSMSTSTESTDAGQPVSITVNADAGSFVGLRAIDQSVLLLQSGNDITQAKVFADLDEYGPRSTSGFWPWPWPWPWPCPCPWPWPWPWPWPIGGGDVSEVFENSGMIVLSDGVVYKSEPEFSQFGFLPALGGAGGGGGFAGFGQPGTPSSQGFTVRVPDSPSRPTSEPRTFFPESWIWTDSQAGDDGSVTFNYNTPDTITTWELSTFALSNVKGLGVPEDTSKITVFRNFFISLNLPASIVRGETLSMKTTVFNYFDFDIMATITLTENEWYDLVIPSGADVSLAGTTRVVVIKSKDSQTITFPIKFKKAGNARIMVRAQSQFAGDAVERTLLVKPEGIPKLVSHSSMIDRQSEFEPETQVTFDVDIPDDAVEGSVYVKFSVSGNILGSALSNLGSLLKIPSGCGEQTMLSFAPDVYISLYLKGVGELEGELKQKSQDHIREGYNNELRYQHDDGAFSAFGKSDHSGSTWLTAFVAKCFIAANELNPVLIEETVISKAVDFILKQQNKDGTFKEPGRVIHESMQGGVESDETTAAYMLIALLEGNMFKKDESVTEAMSKTQKYLENRLPRISDLYTLAIVGYALSLVESAETGKVMALLDAEAIVEPNVKYWKKVESGASKCVNEEDYCPFDDKPSSSAIEITAYVLLLYIKTGRISEVMPIVRWLVQQRGAFGGYQSTQDTVMAIQALSTIARFFADRPTELDITVTRGGDSDFSADFSISDENAIVLQMADLPSVPGNVVVSATGQGVGDVQLTVAYNLPIGPRSDEPFVVDVKLEKTILDTTTMEVCTRINEDRAEVVDSTGMFIVTFDLPSGYTINAEADTKTNPQAKLIELEGEEVTGYFDELPKGKTLCMTLTLIKYADVAGMKPKVLKTVDYYKPQKMSLRMFDMGGDEDICSVCGSACVGCPELGSGPIPPHGDDDLDFDGPSYCTATCPCPDFVDGLYYDTKSHIMQMMVKYDAMTTCSAPNGAEESASYTGLPASLLDGHNQYIDCSGTPYFETLLRGGQYTISIVVSPSEMNWSKYYTIFSLGTPGGRTPYLIFAKRPRQSQFWLKLLQDGQQRLVRSIQSYQISQDSWTKVTIRVDGTEMHVFLNGNKVGKKSSRKVKTDDIISPVTMLIGRSHIGGKSARGNFKGLVSNLDIWSRALTDAEIMKDYQCCEKVISAENLTLTIPQVHHVVPQGIRHCFQNPYTASELKSRAGELRTSCGEPTGPKPPMPE